MGLFLCAEFYEAVFTVTFNKLGSDPVKSPGNLAPIICVFVTVESF